MIETVKKGAVSESRINESVARLLKEKFELGLFENPYVDVEKAEKVVGNAEFQQKADLAMRKSIVLLRNDEKLMPLTKKTKIYFETYREAGGRGQDAGKSAINVNKPNIQNTNIEFVSTKDEADVVLLWLFPTTGGLFSSSGKPIELSLSKNKIDIAHVNDLINSKPTIVAINFTSPWVIDEIDKGKTKSFLATFGTTQDALIDIITGKFNPTGKMPFSTPISEKAAAENKSDVPGSMENAGYSLFKFGDGISFK